jgi:sugar lactone lactonase YvrE
MSLTMPRVVTGAAARTRTAMPSSCPPVPVHFRPRKATGWSAVAGAAIRLLLGTAVILAASRRGVAAPVITEFMASNKTTLTDANGAYSDWIEIHNPDPTPVDLKDWVLTDDASNPTKWRFPAITIPAGGYLVVYASSNDLTDPTKELHTNFGLSADGEYLGLIKPDGSVASDYAPAFPEQFADVSYGIPAGESSAGHLQAPTPGSANSARRATSLDQAVSFSRPAGLFTGTLTLGLGGAGDGQKIRYTATPPSAAGAQAPAPTAESPEYTGPLEFNSSTIVRAAVFSADGLAQGPTATAHYLRYADSGEQRVDNFSSQLPLLVIDNHGFGPMVKDGIYRSGWLYGFAPDAHGSATFQNAPAFGLPLDFAVRGNSSAEFPKKSFKTKLLDTAGKKQAVAPFGLGNYDRWQIIGPWGYDRSYIRNAFMYELSNRIGLWAPRTRFVEVFFNNNADGLTAADHAGVYVLTDRIEPKPGRVEIAELKAKDITAPDITGGYIFKLDWPDEHEYRWTTKGNVRVVLDTPDVDDIAPEQILYLENYIQQFEDAISGDIASQWGSRNYLNYINRDTWIDFHLLLTLSKNSDAFAGSAFFTKDRNGKISAGPLWDFDRSMGSGDERNEAWDEWRSPLDAGDGWNHMWWGKLVRDPDFMQGWIDRWQSLRESHLSDEGLTGLVNELAGQIGEAAANRDSTTHGANGSRFPGGYAGEIAHLKDWLVKRARWIDQQLIAAPSVVEKDGQITVTPPAGASLVYTLDGSDPRRSGDGISSHAQQTTEPLVLPSGSTFAARARANDPVPFPATRWSSRVTIGSIPPPLPPLPQLNAVTTAAGHDVVLSAGTTPGVIRWQISRDNGATWTDLSDNAAYAGTDTATLKILAPGEALNGALYRFTTRYHGATYTSSSARLSVVPVFFPFPTDIAADGSGNLFVADAKADNVGIINPALQVRMLVSENSATKLNRPEGVTTLPNGAVAVADTANDVIRLIDGSGVITNLAGQSGVRGHADGPADAAAFSSPKSVVRHSDGTIYVADAANHVIRKISADGAVTTFVGTAGASGTLDGTGSAARFNRPTALVLGPDGSLFVSDTTNNTIRRVTASGEVSTFAGLAGIAGHDDGTGGAALFNRPGGLAIDGAGNLFVADTGNSTIRKISPDRTVTTFAGLPGVAGVENGTGNAALFNQPQGITLGASGDLFVADTGNAHIRKITPFREVSTLTLSATPPVTPPSPPDPPTTPTTPATPTSGGGSGGGAPSSGFLLSLALLALGKVYRRHRAARRSLGRSALS